MPDLEYATHDASFTTFYPLTDAGREAWGQLCQTGSGKVATIYLPQILANLRKAGYSVRKARPVKQSDKSLLDALTT